MPGVEVATFPAMDHSQDCWSPGRGWAMLNPVGTLASDTTYIATLSSAVSAAHPSRRPAGASPPGRLAAVISYNPTARVATRNPAASSLKRR